MKQSLIAYSANLVLSDKIQGYNPLRWDCNKQGCFNLKRRPKIEVFADCFPRRINFGDVDGIVEINGKALMLEWKSQKGNLPIGQKIMYERITGSGDVTVICVIGNAETMACSEYYFFFKGKRQPSKKANLQDIKERIKKWVMYAQNLK